MADIKPIPARHMVFLHRTRAIIEMGKRIARGHHLVYAPPYCGDIHVLYLFGAQKKRIVVVGTPDEVVQASERINDDTAGRDSEVRFIADDLPGALREAPRKFVTARLDARGPLTDEFVDKVHRVITHGMAQDSLLTVNFELTLAEQETGKLRAAIEAVSDRAHQVDGRTPNGLARVFLVRALAIDWLLAERFPSSKLYWQATSVNYYSISSDDSIFAAEASGRVGRGEPPGKRVGDRLITRLTSARYDMTEEELHQEVWRLGTKKVEDDPTVVRDSLHVLFNLPQELIDQWLANPPQQLSSLSSSEPSSSPTSPSALPRRRFFRS